MNLQELLQKGVQAFPKPAPKFVPGQPIPFIYPVYSQQSQTELVAPPLTHIGVTHLPVIQPSPDPINLIHLKPLLMQNKMKYMYSLELGLLLLGFYFF